MDEIRRQFRKVKMTPKMLKIHEAGKKVKYFGILSKKLNIFNTKIEPVWDGPNKLNKTGNCYESNLEGQLGYEYYEKLYSGHKWWENMKIRMKNKNEKQKDLDRRLVEAIGDPIKQPIMDLEKIKNLVKQGAQMDHWVEDGVVGSRRNAIQLASWNRSDKNDEIIYFLSKQFDFVTKEEDLQSPLSRALMYDQTQRSKKLIEKRSLENPVFAFLLNAGGWKNTITDEEKLEILDQIGTNYNLAKVIKEDLKQIQDRGKFGDSDVRKNLPVLFKFCKRKSSSFLEEVFGKSYDINEPMTWRFTKTGKFKWVAEEIQKRYKNGTITIKNDNNSLKVIFIHFTSCKNI